MLRYIIAILLFFPLWCFSQDFHTFTDPQGRNVVAKPVRIVGNQVEIEREDGYRFTVDPAIFIEKDQEYLMAWVLAHKLEQKDILEVSAKRAETRKERDDSSVGLDIARFLGYYKVELNNRTELTLDALKVEYRTFVFLNEIAGDRRDDGKEVILKGKYDIPKLAPYSKIEFDTEKVKLKHTDLQPGYYWADGGKGKSRDELKGLWLRIFRGDKQIAEYASPSTLPEKYKW